MRHRKYFPQLETLKEKANNNQLQTIFSDCHWFDGTLTYVDSEGEVQHYPNFNFNPQKLYTYWSTMYEAMRVGYACKTSNIWSGPTQEEWNSCAAELTTKAKLWLDLNQAKFLGLIKTFGYKYDPISNYDLYEISGDASKRTKEKTSNTLNGTLTTMKDAPTLKTSTYTTTYDSASQDRLAGYQENTYNGVHREADGGVPVIQETVIPDENYRNDTSNEYEGNVNLTIDEITTPEAHSAEVHKLIRKGNIGVTSTQEMIEQEREIAKQNILDEFFKEFNKGVMLQSWAY